MIRTGLLWSAALIAVMIVVSLYMWMSLGDAESVPVHWGMDGQPNRYGSPAEFMLAPLILIGTSIGVSILMAWTASLKSTREELEKIQPLYLGIWLGTLGLMMAVLLMINWMVSGVTPDAPAANAAQGVTLFVRAVLGLSALFILVLGNYLPKVRQNKVIGIRTPWTLKNTDNWERTNRFAGKLFVLAGLISLILVMVLPLIVSGFVFTGTILAACFIPIWYSYSLSKSK